MVVYTGEFCLTLSVLPWHSMVAARCQELLSFIGFGASSIPPPQRICPCFPKPGQSMRALFLHDVYKSWSSSRSPVDFRYHDICSDCFPLLHAAQIRAGTLVARSTSLRQTSSTVMLPQVAGLFVNAITMYSTLSSPDNTCRHRPRTHNASCLRRLGPDLSTCCLAAASVFGRTTSL